MLHFQYGNTEISHLKNGDEKMAAAIDRIGFIKRPVNPNPFTALLHSVVSQQISSKAADTIWKRFNDFLGKITPSKIAAAEIEALRSCGLSARKVEYVKGIAASVQNKTIVIKDFPNMSDDEIIQKLSALHGVGIWTAEMLLIFSLNRPNVLSWGDLAIRRGLTKLYGIETLSKEQFEQYRMRFTPYGSIASLYLWEISVLD